MRTILLALLVTACGSRSPQGSWIEREGGGTLGATHEATASTSGTSSAAIDLATLDATTIDTLDEARVLTALQRVGDAAPAARLALRAARLAYHRGDHADARALIARAGSAADEPSVHADLTALATRLAQPPIDPRVIAVLLPLTGRFASIGSELRTAIQLAPAAGTTWVFLDTKGEPDGAAAAVEVAIAKGAVGILGPVGQREAISAARAATLHQIPIALLAPDDGADPAAGVFRLVDSPADEGRAVARLAASESFPTVGVFAPRDDIGQEAADAFVAEATRLGLAVTAQASYDPTSGDLEADVKKFLNLVPALNPRLAAHLRREGKKGWITFSPDVAYSLLFIPDRYDRAAVVAAFLPYFGVELRTSEFPDPTRLQRKHGGHMPQVVQLVGGSGWNHPSLPIRGGQAVQGAMIVDAFIGDLGGDSGAVFAGAFQQRTGRSPSPVAAQAHDAATLVANARRDSAGAREPRAALTSAIARGKLDDGACGPAAMDTDGELVREPSVLEVMGDQLIVAP
ncbi:MAG: ABC-type branched-chain amino acid transport system periplasmic component-like protein [Myxococcales bacterium]|nr:ABC-type branched-chain amino acid transport system periplasmic component-like protein [Myxococcales bacterium]